MSRAVYKYELGADLVPQYLLMPEGAELLTVQVQRGQPMLWVLVNPDVQNLTQRQIIPVMTGQERDDLAGAKYIGTVQLADGHLVLVIHYFEGVFA